MLNLIVFWFIDKDFVLLSFALLNLRFLIGVTIFNYISHGGAKQLGALNLPTWTTYLLGYAGEQLHKNHHDHPSDANFGRTSKFNFDVGYHVLRLVTKIRK
jgi:fatty-acid desaturase